MSGPIEQERKQNHKLLSLGYDTYAEVSMFKGKTYASIRRWFQADDGIWYRTKNGLTMPLNEFKDILSTVEALDIFLDEEAKEPYDSSANESKSTREW